METIRSEEAMFIVELTRSEIRLLAQLLHMHLKTDGDHMIGKGLIKSLGDQTNLVDQQAQKHGVYNGFDFLTEAVQSDPVWYIPYDT